jgi:hypothetical protein
MSQVTRRVRLDLLRPESRSLLIGTWFDIDKETLNDPQRAAIQKRALESMIPAGKGCMSFGEAFKTFPKAEDDKKPAAPPKQM